MMKWWSRFSTEMKLEAIYKTMLGVAALVSIIFAVSGLIISIESLSIAEGVREDTRAVEKLDLAPEIYFFATLNENKDANISPHFIIGNSGPIEAIQIIVKLISHRYDNNSKTIAISIESTEEAWQIEELPPLKYSAYAVSRHFLDVNARIQTPLEHNIIEARISYRRNPDRKIFIKRAFYFINPEGLWLPENSMSLEADIYSEMKKELLDTYREIPKMGDILYDVDLKQEK